MYRKSGFTLIELSIVIVIIGLIVAGVVGGQSLIKQAKLRSVMSEFQQYDTAANSFNLEYNALPGDISNAWNYWGTACATTQFNCNGSGNKRIYYLDYPPSPGYDSHENFMAWKHLQVADLVSGSFTGNNAGGGGSAMEAGLNIPGSAYGSGGWVFNSDTRWRTNVDSAITVKNQLVIGAYVEDEPSYGSLFTPQQAQKIDEKLDDGIPFTGKIIGAVGHDGAAYDTNCTSGAGTSATYLLSETTPRCVLAFHLSISGQSY